MNNKNTRILLIEDNPGDTRLVREALAEAGVARFDLVAKMDLAGGLAALDAQPVDAVLLDLTLPDSSGFETFSKLHEKAPQLPIIVLTGADDDVLAAKALREGAQDYLVKGRGNSELLLRSIRYAIQRKQSEEVMRENEARYRNIFEGVEDAIFVETLTGQILDVNQRACDMYGYTREQFLTKTVADLVPSEEYSVLFDPRDPARHSDHPVETINVRSNGEQFPIELSLRKQESKTEPVLFVVCRDSTERKQTEQAIHLMSDTQRQIAQLNDIKEISRLVGKKIHELIGDGYVIISMLDEQIQAMKVVELFGFGSLYEKLVRQFKIDPSKISYPIQDMTIAELHSFRSGKLEKFAGGVYELLTRKVPKKICGLVEKQMKFSGIHTMGFVNQDIHYGALTILEKGDIGPYKDMIETIMNQATISVKRIRAEQALRASEMRYRAVARLSSDFSYSCVHTSGDRYEVDWITDAFFHITGYSEAELRGKPCWMFVVHPQDIQAATEPMLRLQPGESDSREFRIITKSGTVRWFANTMECQSDPSTSGGLRLFGAVQDITARKHAEEARQESELLLRALFELSPDSIMLMDPHTPDDSWPIIECNEAACRINGFERYELIGNSIDMLNAFPANSVDRAAYRKRMREEDGLHLEAFHRHKDGTIFPVGVSTRLIQVGTRELVIGIDRDITGRKQVETALQESEQRYREIFENMSNGVVVYEAVDEGNDFKLNQFNRAAEKIENITRESVIGKTICEAFPGVKEFGLFEVLQRVWKNGQPEHLPITLYTDQRISGWRENYITRLPSGEILVVYDDVTEHKQAEEALRASEELFRSFIEQSSEGVILLDEQGCILEWNRAQAQITGFPAQQAIGEPFWIIQYQMLPPERRIGRSPEFFKQAMLEAFQTGKFPTSDKSIETQIYTPQGEAKYILQASFPIHSGKGYRVGSLVRDITERKHAEMELQASHSAEKDFSERLSALSEVTTELSKAGGVDESCRRAIELGRERLGLDRLSIWFISPDHTTMQGTYGVDLEGRITDERTEHFLIQPDFPIWSLAEGQVPLVHIPGEPLYVDGQAVGQGDHVYAGLWEKNIVTGYLSVDNLLSQRPFSEHDCEIIRLYASAVGRLISLKRAETALRLSEENYRGAIAAAGLVPYGINYETHRFTFMGDNILQLTGYSAEEITPAILKDCVQESHVWGLEATGITQEEAPRRFKSGEIKQWGNDLRITTRSGEERWLNDVSVPLPDKLGNITSAIGIFQDLTERKLAEQALQKSEARFRSIFENTAIGFYQTTPSGQILMANPAILHMLGYESFEDLAHRNLENRDYPPEYPRSEFRRRIEKEEEIRDLEAAWKKNDGTKIFVRENARLVRDESGKVLYYEGTVEDITGPRLAEEKLRKASSYNRRLIEASIDPLVTIGPDGKITDVNKATEAVTGVARNQLIGDDFTNYFTEAAKARESYQKVLADGLVRDYPLTIRHASGKTTDVLYNATVYKNEAGEIQGVFAAARDITERKQVEKALQESEERFRKVFTEEPISMALSDKHYHFLQVNPAFCRMLGYTEQEFEILTFKDITHPEDIKDSIQNIRELESGNAPFFKAEKRYITKTKAVIWGSLTLSTILDQEGQLQFFLVMIEDITERKGTAEALISTERIYRQAITGAGGVPYQVDYSNDRYVFLGEGIQNLTGYLAEEMIGSAFFASHIRQVESYGEHKELPHEQRIQLSRQDGSLQEWREDYLFERKDGTLVWLSDHSVPVLDAAGKLIGSLGILMDITERKQAEESLRESEERYRALFLTSLEGIGLSKGNQILDANQALLDIFGYQEKQDFLKMSLLELVAPESRETIEAYQLRRAQGQPVEPHIEYRIVRKNGEIRDLEISIASVNIKNEIFSLSTFQDITERKQAEAALRESEERFRFIFENANDAIFIENAQDEFLSANQRACKILGYSLEEFQKMHIADIQAPEVRQPGSVIKNEMNQHKGSVFEGLDLHRSGRRIPVEISVGQIEQASGDLFVSIVRDITERKQAETSLAHQAGELRQRNQELARLYRASGSLLSGASSNLQELAQTIIGIIQQEFGQANCSLFLIQRDSSELQRLAAAGPYTDQVKNKTLTLDGPGLVPQAIRTGQTVNVGNVQTVPGYVPNWESAMSEMAVPLKIGNDVIGIIDTQSTLPDAFNKQDEDLMTVFAERAALALEHSRMYEQTEARVQQLAALRTVDMAISSSFDIHLTLDILLDQVRAQLGVHAADILDYNQVTQTFSFSCGQGFRTHALQHTHLRLGEGYAGKAAMERRLLKIPDLHAEPSGFGRSPLLVGENFLSYAGVPLIAKGQIKGVLEIFNREPLDLSSEQQSFLEILAGQAGIAMDNAELYEHQQRSIADLTIAYNDTLEGWASALELRDKETEGHTRRVTNLTIRLARALGVNENDQVQIYRGALLHDIGKIGVPDAIVLKPGPLTAEEWEIMRQHPLYAYNMLSPIGYLREAINVPYCHHEKWDGTGYPRGLKAEEIPLAARIFSVVDVWDALTSDRPYRKAWTHEKARLYITEQSGTQFEPRVVDTFFREVLTQ